MACHTSLLRHGTVVVVLVILVALAVVIGVVVLRHAPAPVGAPPALDNDPLLGRRIYANCQACHGIDGRGIAGYAPTLIAAPSLTGDGQEAMLRVLIGGHQVDGYNAVMPNFSRLTDGEVAAVISYVRSAWGNVGAPIDIAAVTAVRHNIADPRSVP